jgi:hypothetical protein
MSCSPALLARRLDWHRICPSVCATPVLRVYVRDLRPIRIILRGVVDPDQHDDDRGGGAIVPM